MSAKSRSSKYTLVHDPNSNMSQTVDLPSAVAAQQNFTYVTPANPAGTTSTTTVMAGLGVLITPQTSGRVKVFISGEVNNDTAGDGVFLQAAYGTGTPPANGSAATGTVVGKSKLLLSSAAGQQQSFALITVVTGLTVGTQIWVDLQFQAVTGGTASVVNLMILLEEF